jgi:hypothetical protein
VKKCAEQDQQDDGEGQKNYLMVWRKDGTKLVTPSSGKCNRDHRGQVMQRRHCLIDYATIGRSYRLTAVAIRTPEVSNIFSSFNYEVFLK